MAYPAHTRLVYLYSTLIRNNPCQITIILILVNLVAISIKSQRQRSNKYHSDNLSNDSMRRYIVKNIFYLEISLGVNKPPKHFIKHTAQSI